MVSSWDLGLSRCVHRVLARLTFGGQHSNHPPERLIIPAIYSSWSTGRVYLEGLITRESSPQVLGLCLVSTKLGGFEEGRTSEPRRSEPHAVSTSAFGSMQCPFEAAQDRLKPLNNLFLSPLPPAPSHAATGFVASRTASLRRRRKPRENG